MVVWLNKYALTTGIFKIEGEYSDDGKYFRGKPASGGYRYFVTAKDVFEKKEDALLNVEIRRVGKITSLNKQIKKFEKFKPKILE